MDLLFEFLGELLIEGGVELSTNRKVSKYIRYPLLIIISLFFAVIVFGVLFLGLFLLKQNILGGLCVTGLGIFMIVGIIFQVKNIYLKKQK